MTTRREIISRSLNARGRSKVAAFPQLFLSAQRTRALCMLAANEGMPTYHFLRLVAASLRDAPHMERIAGLYRVVAVAAPEKDGLVARFHSPPGTGTVPHLYAFIDPAYPAYDEMRRLLAAIGRCNGIEVGEASLAWRNLRRYKPAPEHALARTFGNEERTLAIVLTHLSPGVPQASLQTQLGTITREDNLVPLVRDGIVAVHRESHCVLYGPNLKAPWASELLALVRRMADLEPDFMGYVRAMDAQRRLFRNDANTRKIAERVFGPPRI